jgi:3-dehydroquinate synthetase
LGHALEALSQERTKGETTLLHGEAVALGMYFAVLLSEDQGHLAAAASAELSAVLQQSGCMLGLGDLQNRLGVADIRAPAVLDDLKRWIGYDKKNPSPEGSKASWILLQSAGVVYQVQANSWTTKVDMADLDATWARFLQALDKP